MTAGTRDWRDYLDPLASGLASQSGAISALQSQNLSMGMTISGQAALISTLQSSLAALPASRFLPGKYQVNGASGVTALPTPTADYLNMYATVVDLFGEKEDNVLCSRLGTDYFWQPVRPIHSKSMSASAANMTIYPLRSPSVLFLTGTLLANRTLSLDTTGVWPGCTREIAFDGALGLFTLNILGTGLGSGLGVLLGGRRRFFYEWGVGWKQFT